MARCCSSEYERLKAEYAEIYARKIAGAAMQLKTYEILLSEFERDRSGIGCVRYDKAGSNPNAYIDGVHDQAVRSSTSLARWADSREEAKSVVDEAKSAIIAVDEAKYRQILELRYLDLMSWKEISAVTGYSTSALSHMKVPALAKLHDVMPLQYRLPKYDSTVNCSLLQANASK